MKFIHLADLHLGKSIHGISLIDSGDQPVWVEQFLELAERLQPDAVLIAGDVYDRSAPSGEAVQLLDRLLTRLAELEIAVLMVAGNHDSGQRLSFAGSLLAREKVHIGGILPPNGRLERVVLEDEHGPVSFWLMPYVFPALAAKALGDGDIRDYDTAVRRLLAAQELPAGERKVLLAHQNVTYCGEEAPRGGSESMVGGLGQVDWHAFDAFDYVALGHIHAANAVGRESLRFAGSPLCYHFNETRQPPKGPVLVELGAPGETPKIQMLHIPPLHPMRELRGSYEQLRAQELAAPRRGE
ncbi:MAG: exonuclease SbcCD subunit D [Oscillospiraceae bacterium]|nr:exonuclease SbcCD subunit D [Oscillospiraceae bacterium]